MLSKRKVNKRKIIQKAKGRVRSGPYEHRMGLEKKSPKQIKEIYDQIADIRKFEIGLYWERAKYFWTLIGAAFVGFYLIFINQGNPDVKYFLSMTVASLGLVFTYAWYLTNKGSKYWQENWENHLDLIEDYVTGPLYKTILERPERGDPEDNWGNKHITGPSPVSVSKVNQITTRATLILWVIFLMLSTYLFFTKCTLTFTVSLRVMAVLAMLVFLGFIAFLFNQYSKTYQGDIYPVIRRRNTRISAIR